MMNTMSNYRNEDSESEVVIVYDGECPICSNYVQFIKIKENVGEVSLINAREDLTFADELSRQGISMDEGMAVMYKSSWYHGYMAMYILATLSKDITPLQKLHNIIFTYKGLASILYPILRFGRNVSLLLLGRKKIDVSNQ